ncbi:hypothetical protein GQ43DRAFT_424653 [Delitschia confertaspora ATCC 74209]|uniref:BTB domain-containing protein n=1 Tax=Delitschia confertaspora ATCC 74209 TaxID=1513339 RepID=A0A9P4JHQ2_9PLEO|nr:hypothetical protein GQ43DRAFT_424653 [Delitschia confertaspora ATCC 74209]
MMARLPTTLPPPYSSTGIHSNSPSNLLELESVTTTTTLVIGPKSTKFRLHRSLLTQHSSYFRAALTGPFLESVTQTIELPDLHVNIFSLFVTWLYTGSITPVPFKDGKPAYYILLNLYILADRLCTEGLRNSVVDLVARLADRTNSVLTPSDIRILYERILDTAPLRALVLDLFAFKKTEKLLGTHPDSWHAQFLRDLVVHLKKPYRQAILRHELCPWVPGIWHAGWACERCRRILAPRFAGVACRSCARAWCTECVGREEDVAKWEDGMVPRGGNLVAVNDEIGEKVGLVSDGAEAGAGTREVVRREVCKPWRGSRCRFYHEHRDTKRCAEVFEGR